MEKVVEVSDLIKCKGKKKILHKVSLELNSGEIVGFLGANGAGKTTTLKCILGLYRYQGNIKILGQECSNNNVKVKECISGLIEEPCFYSNLTGAQNIKLNMMYHKRVTKKKLEEVVHRLKMEEYVNKKVKSYSLGMKQRLGLATVLISNPQIILLDEPMNGLDPDGIRQLRELLIELAHKENKAVLVSSHILSEMQMLCDRVIFIKKGIIVGNEKVSENLEQQYIRVMEEKKQDE